MSPPRTISKRPLSYQEDAARLKVTSQRDLGLNPIPVSRIIGSAGKPDQLDANFKPIMGGWAGDRFAGLLNATKSGTPFQPISVYKLHDYYYVIDGHNRVAAAKEVGQKYIDAYVTEALPKDEGFENNLYYERKHFEERTGLTRIHFSELGRFPRLTDLIQAYTGFASFQHDDELSLLQGASLWYREVYRPTASRIKQSGLRKSFPKSTVGDIFFRVWECQIALSKEREKPLTLYEAFFEFVKQNPGPITRRVVRRGLEAVTAPLPFPPKPPDPEDDSASDEFETGA